MNKYSIHLCIVFLFLNCLVDYHVQAQSDTTLFRVLYDQISNLVTPGPSPDGTFNSLVLLEIPGISIRREDYDPKSWANAGYSPRMPAALVAELVDRVPRYTSLTFIDSGYRISQLWGLLLTQYVAPYNFDAATQLVIASARERLANSTLEVELGGLMDAYSAELENSLSERSTCLSSRDPSICAQLAVGWRDRVRRKWYSMEVVRSELEAAQSQLIGAQLKDFTAIFSSALEKTETQRRVDIGAVGYGTSFYNTFLSPSDWYSWFPFDVSEYDLVIDYRSPATSTGVLAVSAGASIEVAPLHGTLALYNATAIVYTPPSSAYVGPDSFSVNDGGQSRVVSVLVNGALYTDTHGAQWSKVSMTQNSIAQSTESAYSILHSASSVTVEGAIAFTGSFASDTVNTQARYSFAQGNFAVSFEMARVKINRPWLDMSLLTLDGIGLRGVRQFGWSSGSTVFSLNSKLIWSLLPTEMIVARNILLQSSQITAFSSTFSNIASGAYSASASMGPFVFGQRYSSTGSSTFNAANYDTSSNTLSIDGPQIIGWVCAPLPAFPSADATTVMAQNDVAAINYFRGEAIAKTLGNGSVDLASLIQLFQSNFTQS